MLMLIGALALVLAYFSYSPVSDKKLVASGSSRSKNFERSVNKHLMFTNDRMDMERRKIEIENKRLLMDKAVIGNPSQVPYSNEGKLDLSSAESSETLVASALGRGARVEEISSPQDVVQKEVFTREQMAEYTQAYKEEYARQFIENARKGGYKVILSEDMSRVISVQSIRDPSKGTFQVQPSNSSPAQ